MIKVIENYEQGVKTYAVDSEEELKKLPKTVNYFGSSAICIETGDVYMLNGSGVWKKI